MTTVSLILAALLSLHCMSGHDARDTEPPPVLPDSIDGWTTDYSAHWDRQTLYDYIDGGAELFLSYSFEGAVSRSYRRADQPDITVDVFRFARPEDAYGVYSMSREDENTMIGAGGQYGAGLLLFWKDRYYVSILASPETPEAREAVMRLARLIETQIEGETAPPALTLKFPPEGLRASTVRYFLHHAWQNVYGFISNDDILRIADAEAAAAAKYRLGEKEATVLLIQYGSGAAAQSAYEAWRGAYGGDEKSDTVLRDDGWFAAAVSDGNLVLVHRATDEQTARSLREKTIGMFR